MELCLTLNCDVPLYQVKLKHFLGQSLALDNNICQRNTIAVAVALRSNKFTNNWWQAS